VNKLPGWALLAAAIAAVGLVIFMIPDSKPTAGEVSSETVAKLVTPSDSSSASPTFRGVTSPAAPQPPLDLNKLAPGQKAPQFVILSFDGGVESKTGIMQHYLDLAQSVKGRFSYFISGVYLLPDNKTKLVYDPPQHPRGTSAIGFANPDLVATRINKLTQAWADGNEIGTHYMGHFCGANGVGAWSQADWASEIKQENDVIDNWNKYNPQAATAGPLPFDSSVIKGGRTPCLEGKRPALYKAMAAAGYRYDTSNSGGLRWPKKNKYGLWDIPLQGIKVAGLGDILSMDYNFMANQNGAKTTAAPDRCKQIEDQTYNAYRDALKAVDDGNRAPLILGNHMNEWVCSAYKNALTRFVEDTHKDNPDVRFISTIDLVNWMEAQDPAVLKALRKQPAEVQ